MYAGDVVLLAGALATSVESRPLTHEELDVLSNRAFKGACSLRYAMAHWLGGHPLIQPCARSPPRCCRHSRMSMQLAASRCRWGSPRRLAWCSSAVT